MKHLIYLILLTQCFLLSACQRNEIEPVFSVEDTKFPLELDHKRIPNQNDSELTPTLDQPFLPQLPSKSESSIDTLPDEHPERMESESDESTSQSQDSSLPSIPKTEGFEGQEEVTPPILPSPEQQSLYLENGPGRQYYETKPYLSSSEKITISDGEKEFATLQFKSYKIVEDNNGSGRQGLVLYFLETNTSNEKIEVGLAGRVINPVLNHSVFYQENQLKKMPKEQWLKFADADYIETKHVTLPPKDVKVESCADTKILKPGKSRECYVHYSYAGPGEYLINQAVDQSYTTFKSFIIEVK